MKRAADNKRRYAPGWVHSTCLLRGFPKGAAPHLAHDFAEQSVVCYTLCRRCRENAVAAGEGRQENRAVLVWRGAASAGLFSSADRAYMKVPSLVLRRTSGQNVPNLWTHSRKNRRIFLSKLKWAGSRFRALLFPR